MSPPWLAGGQRLPRWSTDVAGARRCRPLEGAGPLAVFRATESGALVPLPATPFELARWSTPKVHDDCHVKVGKTLYSVPWRHIGEVADARTTTATVAVYVRGDLVQDCECSKARADRPTSPTTRRTKVAFLQKTPVWCRGRAKEVGPGCTEAHRRAAGDQRASPPPRRPGDPGPRRPSQRCAWRRPAGGRSRPGDPPPHGERDPRGGNRDGSRAGTDGIRHAGISSWAGGARRSGGGAATAPTSLWRPCARSSCRGCSTPSTPASPRPVPATSATSSSSRSSARTRSPAGPPNGC